MSRSGIESAQENPIIEVRTQTDEEVMLNWAAQNKISPNSVERLFKDGFTTMGNDNLQRTKIPRGQ